VRDAEPGGSVGLASFNAMAHLSQDRRRWAPAADKDKLYPLVSGHRGPGWGQISSQKHTVVGGMISEFGNAFA
jgi:hypothetical protein